MRKETAPPASARRLLAWTLPQEIRDEVLGDLEQQYHEQPGDAAAARWYWRQVLSYALSFAIASARARIGDLLAACFQPGWMQDLRHARRSLTRAWGFAVTVTLILGIGLGLTTAIFSLCYGILVRPFPYAAPDALVRIDWTTPAGQGQASSLDDLARWREGSPRSISAIGAFSTAVADIDATRGPAETVQVTYATAGTLALLGVAPQIGRLFDAREETMGGDVHKAILSHALWTRRFGQDPGVIGRTIRTGETTLEIVGVMPPGFGFPQRTDLWIPVESFWASSALAPRRQTVRLYAILARLAPGSNAMQARDELQALASRSAVARQEESLRVRTLREVETGQLRPYLIALLGGVAGLALICLTNVSSLQLARGASRAREFAVRAAIGASTGRNLRVPLAESLLLALGGAVLAALVAVAGLRALIAWIPVPLPAWMRLEVDTPALVFCVGISIVVSAISSIAPAAWALGSAGVLLKSARGSSDGAGIRKGLVIGEIALSTLLLVCAGLLMQTLLGLQQREPGFRPEGLLTVQVSRAQAGNTEARLRTLPALHARALDRLAALPGVTHAAATNRLPFAVGASARTVANLQITGATGSGATQAAFFGSADVTPDYFATMGIPLREGRGFTAQDGAAAARVVIVNERAALQLWPGQHALGQQVTWGTPRPDNPPATVIGIAGNVRDVATEGDRGLEFYYPYAQFPGNGLFYVLRTSIDPASLISTVRQAIADIDPTIAVSAVKTMPQWMDESLWQTRLWGALFGLFAIVALLLAAAGLYGLVAYLVGRRAKEMAIRRSIGATDGQIARLVLGGMLRLILPGVAAGLGASLIASRAMATLLFEAASGDLRLHLLVAVTVIGVTLLACSLPLLRTRRVNVLAMLQED